MSNFPNIPDVNRKGRLLIAYSGSDIEYIGKHTYIDAATTDPSWEITRLLYSGSDIVGVQKLTGAWDNRASLSWEA